jgi:hypothetical protein
VTQGGGTGERVDRAAADAVARVRNGRAVFLPVTPTMRVDALVEAVTRVAGASRVAVTVDARPEGVYVSAPDTP